LDVPVGGAAGYRLVDGIEAVLCAHVWGPTGSDASLV
jgi:hypothetical protein